MQSPTFLDEEEERRAKSDRPPSPFSAQREGEAPEDQQVQDDHQAADLHKVNSRPFSFSGSASMILQDGEALSQGPSQYLVLPVAKWGAAEDILRDLDKITSPQASMRAKKLMTLLPPHNI